MGLIQPSRSDPLSPDAARPIPDWPRPLNSPLPRAAGVRPPPPHIEADRQGHRLSGSCPEGASADPAKKAEGKGKAAAAGRRGIETGGGGEVVGAEDRVERSGEVAGAEREEVVENLSKSALAARRESEPTEEVVSA
ncbi:hypothetical protein Scep_004953 [Stephania cephalantha]|uniref:Uncharacterized protein n=1 Tax=Stephania cephalantha TaxID=152367 RepID=A0AAP0PXR6_9MAGN